MTQTDSQLVAWLSQADLSEGRGLLARYKCRCRASNVLRCMAVPRLDEKYVSLGGWSSRQGLPRSTT